MPTCRLVELEVFISDKDEGEDVDRVREGAGQCDLIGLGETVAR